MFRNVGHGTGFANPTGEAESVPNGVRVKTKCNEYNGSFALQV
jgi:hypothetical protein